MEKTNVIKLKYLRAGQPSGREYTFYTPALAMMFLWGREIGLREARQEAEAIEDNGGEY